MNQSAQSLTSVHSPLLSSSRSELLISYFRSGWAFLIPYLATYLLYAWLKWPVNPIVSDQSPAVSSQSSWIPCLLHVYWFLHGLHFIVGIMAFATWWQSTAQEPLFPTDQSGQKRSVVERLWPVVPWLLLALIFWIPGVYLEWPSDPWEHLRRITEWATHISAGGNSAGYKSFYFFSYSFLANFSQVDQIALLDIYSTCINLLLAWQYFRLAKAVGLESRWAFITVIANILLFGNVCFSFYRYYTLASTMYSQLGAIALTRLVIEYILRHQPSQANNQNNIDAAKLDRRDTRGTLVSIPLLLALIGLNHVQGIGIACVGIAAILAWRVFEEKPKRICLFATGVLVLSVCVFLWWPRHPIVSSVYRSEGWMTSWYGFNLAWPSPAADRSVQIMGTFGVANFIAGIVLLRRNHLVGWLTVGPLVALILPFVALPFANSLASKGPSEIIVFHRMLFGIPSGLAIIVCLREWSFRFPHAYPNWIHRSLNFLAFLIIFGCLITLAPNTGYNNRLWHLISATPRDLQFEPMLRAVKLAEIHFRINEDYVFISTDAISNSLNACSPKIFPYRDRKIGQPDATSLESAVAYISYIKPTAGRESPSLIQDSMGVDQAAWISPSGFASKFATTINDFWAGSTALENLHGRATEVLTAAEIPVDPLKNYCVEMSLRQVSATNATAYLAVAWYDAKGDLLNSSVPQPAGAGAPAGWNNGAYSYFGPIAGVAPTRWTTYRTSFGRGENAAIPSNAKSARIGALLNYNSTPSATLQLTNIRLWPKEISEQTRDGVFQNYAQYFIIIPNRLQLFSYASQAAQLSAHWPANQLPSDMAGGPELRTAVLSAGGNPVDTTALIFKLSRTSISK